MKFTLPTYHQPDFSQDQFTQAPNVHLEVVEKDGVSPANYHALSIYPEYFKVNGRWLLATESRMDTVCVVDDTPGQEALRIVEFRNLKKGDKVVIGRKEDASQGIYVYDGGFAQEEEEKETFAFRQGRSRETAFSMDYDQLYDLLAYEKAQKNHITWVLGSAISYDRKTSLALEKLIENGYVSAIICPNALATFDLEQASYGSVWNQEVFHQDYAENRNFIRTINRVRQAGSMENYIKEEGIQSGFVAKALEHQVPLVISGTIRDRLTLPECHANVYEAQDAMRAHTRKSSTVMLVASVLFSIATGNMTPSYNEIQGQIRPVFIYAADIQEFTVNKLTDRGSLSAKSFVTNVQDFIQNIARALTQGEEAQD